MRTLQRLRKIEQYMWNRLARTMPSSSFEDQLAIDQHTYMMKIQDLIDEVTNEND